MPFGGVSFFPCFADVGCCSSFRSRTDVVIVYCAQGAAWGSFAGMKREQPVYVLLAASSTAQRDKGTAPAGFLFGRMWHRFFSNRVLLQGWWGFQS